MLEFLITVTAGAIGFMLARNFVRRRLRFVGSLDLGAPGFRGNRGSSGLARGSAAVR